VMKSSRTDDSGAKGSCATCEHFKHGFYDTRRGVCARHDNKKVFDSHYCDDYERINPICVDDATRASSLESDGRNVAGGSAMAIFPSASDRNLQFTSSQEILGTFGDAHIKSIDGNYKILLTKDAAIFRRTNRLASFIYGALGFLALPAAYGVSQIRNMTWGHFVFFAIIFGVPGGIAIYFDYRSKRKFHQGLQQGGSIHRPHFAIPVKDLLSACAKGRYGGEPQSAVVPCTILDIAGTDVSLADSEIEAIRKFLREKLGDDTIGANWFMKR
jgi:hypothetical protein